MGSVSRLSLHERDQIKALSTTDYTAKQIVDVTSHINYIYIYIYT
uniref:Transposase n=1 Tax=Heterorhabditis bacteriophora TaxID=37862 RepID=A0A1I7WNW9_HETBA